MNSSTYIYLHGFASSPHSTKAQYLRDRFQQYQLTLTLLDLNQKDFFNLTLTRQLEQVGKILANCSTPITLIGSSFGGLTAAWLGEKYPQVQRLVLLAPAFGFLPLWLDRLGESAVQQWQETGELLVYHYGEQRSLPLGYQFVSDTRQYDDYQLQRPIPTLILHGKRDDVIPITASYDYVESRPWVQLKILDSDHGLTDVIEEIWVAIKQFCKLP